MDFQAAAQILGNIGEFVGSIAVVATLAYLTVQVRQAKQASNDAIRLARAEAGRDMGLRLMESEHLVEVFRKINAVDGGPGAAARAFMARYGLTEEEAARYSNFLFSQTRLMEISFIQPDASRDASGDHTRLQGFTDSPGFGIWWQHHRQTFDGTFRSAVDSVIPHSAV